MTNSRVLIILTTFLVLTATILPAADLTGVWITEMKGPGGETMKSTYVFQQEGTSLSGTVATMMGELPIEEGEVNDDRFRFVTKMKFGDREMTIRYEGVIDGDDFTLRAVLRPDMPPREMKGSRATGEEARQATEKAPAEPIPELKTLPDNGLARTPPMGWNSWNHFKKEISDRTVREIADAMVRNGMRDAGYVYVNIDDGWQGQRDDNGVLQPNEKFPDMKALADYVHGQGLKIGIYSSPGPRTCGREVGSYGHEVQDAKMFADWGFDYLKYDWCSAGGIYKPNQMRAVYQKMAEALRATGRPIVLSICQYGMEDVWKWGPAAGGNLWRTTFDISPSWESMKNIGFAQGRLAEWAGPGHWNDPDMLEVGNEGLTDTENLTHMSLWSLLAAPLLAGNDLRDVSEETLGILTNPEVIAINQDKLGRAASPLAQGGDLQVWVKELSGGRRAVGLFNLSEEAAKIEVKWADLDLPGPLRVRDVWARADRGAFDDGFSEKVPAHGATLIVVAP